MKLFKQYRYIRIKNLRSYLFATALLVVLLVVTGFNPVQKGDDFYPGNNRHSNNEGAFAGGTKKKKKKISGKKDAPADLASINREEFRKLEIRLLEKEAKLKSYEPIAPDVEFRVQILASKKNINPAELKKQLGLPGEIKVDLVNGWYKYTYGSFTKYRQAREERKKLISRNFIYDAFVVAYQLDKRISLSSLVQPGEWEEENMKVIASKLLPVEKGKYSIRFLRVHNMMIPVETIRDIYGIDDEVYCQQAGGWYHYITGKYKSYNEAAKIRNIMRMEGNTDALVVGKGLNFQNPESAWLSSEFMRPGK